MSTIKMYDVYVESKNDPSNNMTYHVNRAGMVFLGRVFCNSHYIVEVEEVIYSENEEGIFPKE